jgi:hypothetical protein
MERENLDLKIANRGKDLFIEQLQKEQKGFFEQLLTANHKMRKLGNRHPGFHGGALAKALSHKV